MNFIIDNNSNSGDFSFDFQNSDGRAVWHIWEPLEGSILSVRNNGRVGIGTSTPNAKLEVIGNAKVRGNLIAERVTLDVGSFPDYVFEENYPLRSLADLESFIKENKHLPGIKPETEIVNEGMDVAELNKALVEKVEELTLYTIQQEKKPNELDNKYQKLLNIISTLELNKE